MSDSEDSQIDLPSAPDREQDKDATLYVGNLDERVTDGLVYELMTQAAVVRNVHLPKDRVTQNHQGYGFVEFADEENADYAAKLMNGIRLNGKPIRVNKASADRRAGPGGQDPLVGVGAELFVGNLDATVDEKTLYETFSRFGPLVAAPKVAKDQETNLSKGYGFISYASFEASDDAINTMHGKLFSNKEIVVQYAYKKDGHGERHGDEAERALAAAAAQNGVKFEIPALPASLVLPNSTPTAPQGMQNGFGGPPQRPMGGPPAGPPGYGGYGGGYNPSPGPYGMPNGAPPTGPSGGMPPPSRNYAQSPLQAPSPSHNLPPRPPPSSGGYGGPQSAPGMAPPQGMPPGGMPPGFSGMPPGAPGMGPPGMQGPPGYGRGAPNGYSPQQR
ncbi:hypothetical protein MBLNU230_g2209t1 [Neophaeotheca triangularis]